MILYVFIYTYNVYKYVWGCIYLLNKLFIYLITSEGPCITMDCKKFINKLFTIIMFTKDEKLPRHQILRWERGGGGV